MNDPEVLSATYWLSWIDPVKTVAEAGVVFCLAVGLILSIIGSPLSKKVENAREAEISRLRKETAQAQGEIAEANARQKEAEERTEVIRQSLDRAVMLRRLSPEIFGAELKDVPPATVQILYDSNVSDAMMLASTLAISLLQLN